MNTLSPIVSKFETQEEAAAYDHWFRTKVAACPADSNLSIPHEVMTAMRRRKPKPDGLNQPS